MRDFKPVRWGILGASNFALKHMAPAIVAARNAEVTAIASSSADKVLPFRDIAPGLRHHTEYEALLADPAIDAVYIPLPNHLHVEWSEKALRAGKAVLCEKPMALSAGDFDRLIAARNETGLLISEAFMIVHHPQWQRVKELLSQGLAGDLWHVNAAFSYNNRDSGNIRNKAETGGGGLRDIGVYTFGSVRFATAAEPLEMTHAHLRLEHGVDVFAEVGFEFPGFTYQSMTGIRMATRQEVHFHGSLAVISVTCPFNANVFDIAEIRISYPNQTVVTERFPAVNQYVLQVETFGAALRGDAEWPWSLEDARGTQAMIDSVLAAE
ncbi:Gfo/Idh/MocA family protein [Pseudooceanicola spongiae]|uniref:Gfo/Idh/MocA family oxidoreductase n=1 Tax=Pseudooceanicola spongiae TaxID=2613965 RepID=A0A7L9WIF3_9RHOB|nr:Gfo/Idh/MocA family oxidoreductase [Pseudooceanicola spongiae]QOL79594.1 gfo/Idh/MocA family oxidoreductase [Pseudooceanicola spongiae]